MINNCLLSNLLDTALNLYCCMITVEKNNMYMYVYTLYIFLLDLHKLSIKCNYMYHKEYNNIN